VLRDGADFFARRAEERQFSTSSSVQGRLDGAGSLVVGGVVGDR
jgi:hypothetical protein